MSDQPSEPPSPYDFNRRAMNDASLLSPGLVLVSTPIGNLADMSHRAIAYLTAADLVLCEDTRVTAKLLSAYGISQRVEPLHEHNEKQRIPGLLDLLRQGKRIVLVSDAGTPLLSDPGFRLVREAITAQLPVTATPGANAAIMALTVSGLPPNPFLFIGFPPPRSTARRTSFAKLNAAESAGLSATLIWYEAPHRLIETLEDLATIFGGWRQAVVARELTKRFEEVRRGTLDTLVEHYHTHAPRGEITILVGPASEEAIGTDKLDQLLRHALLSHSVKDAAILISGTAGLPRRIVYTRALELSLQAPGPAYAKATDPESEQ